MKIILSKLLCKISALAFVLCTLTLSFRCMSSIAGITEEQWVVLQPNSNHITRHIRNMSENTVYYRVTLHEITNLRINSKNTLRPAHVRLTSKHMCSSALSVSYGLMAVPGRLIIPREGQQSVHFIFCGNRSQDRFFHIRIVRATREELDEFPVSRYERKRYDDNRHPTEDNSLTKTYILRVKADVNG